jgi:hypothetical protein
MEVNCHLHISTVVALKKEQWHMMDNMLDGTNSKV